MKPTAVSKPALKSRLHLWIFTLLFTLPVGADELPWGPTSTRNLTDIPAPPGTERIAVEEGSFGAWLRSLPLKLAGAKVHYFDGRVKPRKVHVAVLDIDVGKRDLQQCADAVIRLRAEYLWARGCRESIAFDFTSGDRSPWAQWAAGRRPVVEGRSVRWQRSAEPDGSYRQFRRYLDSVFTYAGSFSLAQELKPVSNPALAQPGDVLIQGGFPGHAVIVVDVAESRTERRLLLAQSYMPAQEIHVLGNPESSSPWYRARSSGSLVTPEWTFEAKDLKRFSPLPCDP